MSEAMSKAASTRGARRRAQTRSALVKAAQQLIAENRTTVAILEITQLADVGMGSFYNHFDSREQLFEAAVDDALEQQGAFLDQVTAGLDDPAEAFARSFRMVGRLHRQVPELSRVLLSQGAALVTSDHGLAPRALRDIRAAVGAGRFSTSDPDAALLIAGGAALALAQHLHEHPDADDAALTDTVTESLLLMLGLGADDARAIVALDLPDVGGPLEEFLAASPAEPV
ncbi:TetR/AcrR family transcriptional regulator [Nocardioides nitrophenolicus]|uniref:TetR/AcrR family transcriptional regulator n=1 Tax=Nocardioides nitrophenolicus TaxID=60489 RepID=UPI001959FC58|nr:TetR/AcrR family transcriptional regulator [Nocardioides nitrophenolicus]MBM7517091.1 AcrR family transcriptional regulator [Nocardioides nitrophenolicus]